MGLPSGGGRPRGRAASGGQGPVPPRSQSSWQGHARCGEPLSRPGNEDGAIGRLTPRPRAWAGTTLGPPGRHTEHQPVRRRTAVIGCCAHQRATRRPRRQRSAHSGFRAPPGRGDGGSGWTVSGCRDTSRSAGDRRPPRRSEANDGIGGASADSSSSVLPCPTPPDASRWNPAGLTRLPSRRRTDGIGSTCHYVLRHVRRSSPTRTAVHQRRVQATPERRVRMWRVAPRTHTPMSRDTVDRCLRTSFAVGPVAGSPWSGQESGLG
jgi:hypothetical protein